jgi:hypothetical protein
MPSRSNSDDRRQPRAVRACASSRRSRRPPGAARLLTAWQSSGAPGRARRPKGSSAREVDSPEGVAREPTQRRRIHSRLGLSPDDERNRQVGVGPRRPVTPVAAMPPRLPPGAERGSRVRTAQWTTKRGRAAGAGRVVCSDIARRNPSAPSLVRTPSAPGCAAAFPGSPPDSAPPTQRYETPSPGSPRRRARGPPQS